jgi:hypothetical protein
LVIERPFSLDENISSLDTVENLASAGAVPVVTLEFSAKAGLASNATDAAISANFFILSSKGSGCVASQCEDGTIVPGGDFELRYDAARVSL